MSLDFTLTAIRPTVVYDGNITHNLTIMADEAGIYKCLWRPDEHGMRVAADIIDPLRAGIALLESDPEKFKSMNPKNGWGSYKTLLKFAHEVLDACVANPDARVSASR